MKGERLSGLDALRGIAALLVVADHAQFLADKAHPGLFAKAYLAVDFFFMLSGFVLSRAYDARLLRSLSPVGFVVARLRRLWPMMALGSVLGFVSFLQVFQPRFDAAALLLGLLFIPMLLPPNATFPINPPSWSIFSEIVANALHGSILVRASTRALACVAALSLIVLLMTRRDIGAGPLPSDIWLSLFRVAFSYSLGMLIWRTLGDRARAPLWIALILLPSGIIAARFLPDQFDFVFAALLCPAILICGMAPAGRTGAALGALSFPLYAVHYPIVRAVVENGGNPLLAILLAIGVASLLAWLPRYIHSIANHPPEVVSEPVLQRANNSK